MSRKILVTAALPYANGAIHIGHMIEYLQTDIWARFQRLSGNECIFCCADDAHGTPIMLSARQKGITPEQLIASMQKDHEKDFAAFGIHFDSYYSTHSEENKAQASKIYLKLKAGDHIGRRKIEQAYDEKEQMFLPDRFVRGICPKCKAEDQYGDSCDACSATYSPLEMIAPVSVVSGETPIAKESEHLFFKLSNFEVQLVAWIKDGHVHETVKNKLLEWFNEGLQDWCISRDKPYFGFEIPQEKDKFFYVWLDAPIGYMASATKYCQSNGLDFDTFWNDPEREIYHFIGKDIINFHALFWPAMLMGAGYQTPKQLAVHGFLTVDGKKMSKSRGTFINASTYLKHLDPQFLRYYYCCKLSNGVEDIDLSIEDFVSRVNSDLVGKLANLVSRSVPMLNKKCDGVLGALSDQAQALVAEVAAGAQAIAAFYEARQFSHATRAITTLADKVNQYFDHRKPWAAIKEDVAHAHETLTATLNAARILTVYLKPVLPEYAKKVETILNIDPLDWQDSQSVLENHKIGKFVRLIERIELEKVEAMIEDSKASLEAVAPVPEIEVSSSPEIAKEPVADEINIDTFFKVDMRVAKVLEAKYIEGADKLIGLKLSLGGDEVRQVFAGIKKFYDPENLVGKKMIFVANLKPRKMKFGVSEGMIVCASGKADGVYALTVDEGAVPGMRVG